METDNISSPDIAPEHLAKSLTPEEHARWRALVEGTGETLRKAAAALPLAEQMAVSFHMEEQGL